MASSSLTIYTASAGAGKTHTLTGEYLRIALSNDTPGLFRRIQAVTFTNKATAEMKERILQDLYLLAKNPDESPYRTLFDCSTYTLQSRARKTLREMLTDYSSMRVKTIDSFFQEILRSFARELSLDGGYRVILDKEKMLADAATLLISDPYRGDAFLVQQGKSDLLRWLKEIARELIEKGQGHNLLREVKSLGVQLFREDVIEMSSQRKLPSRQALGRLQVALMAAIRAFEEEAMRIALEAADIFERSGCSFADFIQGSSGPVKALHSIAVSRKHREPSSYFRKVVSSVRSNGDLSVMLSASAKAKKKPPCNEQAMAVAADLFKRISDYYDLYEKDGGFVDYQTALEVIRFVGRYGIVGELHRIITDIEAENKTMLLSGSTAMISRLMAGEDFAPVLYERIGTRIDHHMIDEFQDTSRKQYDNFRPLLEQSLSNHRANLVVGDVKQSIYRFRNSDRRILAHDIGRHFSGYEPEYKDLADNWRSVPQIIAFNNALFAPSDSVPPSPPLLPTMLSALVLEEMSKDLKQGEAVAASQALLLRTLEESVAEMVANYTAPAQSIPSARSEAVGAVVVHYCEEEEEGDQGEQSPDTVQPEENSENQSPDLVLRSLSKVIIDLQDRGYKPADIAILVRTGAQAEAVAQALMTASTDCPRDRSLRIVSAEALAIQSSPCVRFVVNVLQMISHPGDAFYVGLVEASFLEVSGGREDPSMSEAFAQRILPTIQMASHLGLYEMVDSIALLANEFAALGEQPYILSFLDMVAAFCRYGQADARGFVQYWEELGKLKHILAPDSEDAMSLLTIHKSKGLGFPVVLIPFPSWDLCPQVEGTILWCKTADWKLRTHSPSIREALESIDKVPIRYAKAIKQTHFAQDYVRELVDSLVDNLNILYVAFTRAKTELHFWLPNEIKPPKKGQKKKPMALEPLLYQALQSMPQKGISLDIHSWYHYPDHDIRPSALPLQIAIQKDQGEVLKLRAPKPSDIQHRPQIRLRTRGAEMLADNEQIAYGRAMHQVLEQVETPSDLPEAIEAMISEGALALDDAPSLLAALEEKLTQGPAARWFDGSATVLNEVTIVGGGKPEKRPDRILIYPQESRAVVVDYKFGSTPLEHYKYQIVRYKALLSQMGYAQVEGYLWNPMTDDLLEVQ